MQIEIKNPRYIQLMIAKCNKADNIKNQMMRYAYLKQGIEHYAFTKANQIDENMGELNITDKQKKELRKLVNRKVCELIETEMLEDIETENLFFIDK